MKASQAYQFIEEKVEEYWEAFSYVLPNIGNKPKIEIVNKNSGTAGLAYHSGRVEYNLPFFLSHTNEKELVELVAHELAHIVQFRCYPKAKQAHGPEFRYIMQSVGFSGRTYHSMNVSKAKAASKDMFSHLMDIEI